MENNPSSFSLMIEDKKQKLLNAIMLLILN